MISVSVVLADDNASSVAEWDSPSSAPFVKGDVISIEGQPNLRIAERIWSGPYSLTLVVRPTQIAWA